jgi:hypothetical protein
MKTLVRLRKSHCLSKAEAAEPCIPCYAEANLVNTRLVTRTDDHSILLNGTDSDRRRRPSREGYGLPVPARRVYKPSSAVMRGELTFAG